MLTEETLRAAMYTALPGDGEQAGALFAYLTAAGPVALPMSERAAILAAPDATSHPPSPRTGLPTSVDALSMAIWRNPRGITESDVAYATRLVDDMDPSARGAK